MGLFSFFSKNAGDIEKEIALTQRRIGDLTARMLSAKATKPKQTDAPMPNYQEQISKEKKKLSDLKDKLKSARQVEKIKKTKVV